MQQGPFASPSCPTEILSRIFECCIDWLQLHEPPLGLPPSLTATCQRWREVAFSSPRLWSSIYVDFDESGETETHSLLTKQHSERLFLFQTWLARSKSAPLQCGISGGQVSRADQIDFMTYLGCMLLHADHWSAIEIFLLGDLDPSLSNPASYRNYPGAQRRDSLAIPRDFSSSPLEHLDLYWDSYLDCSAFERAFEFAHNLRTLRFNVPHLTRWRFPWSQLTALCIGEVVDNKRPVPLDIPWLLVTLSQCRSLEFLAIASQDIRPCMPLPSTEHVVLNRVREAHFDSWDPNVLDILLRVISVPSVQKLSFNESTSGSLPLDGESLIRFISNHAATLRELFTNRIKISNQTLLRCYRSAANLSHIHLSCLVVTPNASELLRGLVLQFRDDGTPLEGQNIQLQTLTLHFGVRDDLEDPASYLPIYLGSRMDDLVEPLLDIIRSRWKPPTNAARSDDATPIAVLDTLHIEGNALEWMKKRDPERYGYLMKAVDEGFTLLDEHMGRDVWPDLPQ